MNSSGITGRKLKQINVYFFVVSDGRVAQAELGSWVSCFFLLGRGTGTEMGHVHVTDGYRVEFFFFFSL